MVSSGPQTVAHILEALDALSSTFWRHSHPLGARASVEAMLEIAPDAFTHLLSLEDGLFTRQEALHSGVNDDVLTAAVRRRAIVRICRGVYTSPRTWSEAEHRYLLARAALRVYPDAILIGATAVAAHGISLFEVPVVRADIARPVQREACTEHVRIRPLRQGRGDTDWGPASPLAEALVQLTMDHGVAAGLASIDEALHTEVVTEEELEAAFHEIERWPHSSRVRCALAWCDPDAESMGESITRMILLGAGLPVLCQMRIADHDGVIFARVDLAVEGTMVLVEFDGKVKYSDGGPDALFKEKKREDRLRALGYIVVRVTWADLYHPHGILARVKAAMAVAA